jgi:hypothetical protein
MGQPESQPGFIQSKRGAIVALCVTGFAAALSVRNLAFQCKFNSHHKFNWLLDWGIFNPPWAVATVNLAFYGYSLWLAIAFYRMAQGKERIIVVGFFTGLLLYPIRILASPPVDTAINYTSNVATIVAFVVAIYILVAILRRQEPADRY